MALVDPNIAMGFRGVEIPNQLAQFAQVSQIQNAQLQNQLARQQMEQEQGALNYLRGANLATPEGRSGLRQFGKTGLAYEKMLSEQEMNALKRQELEGKLRDQRMTALGTGLTSVLNDPSDASLTAAFDRLDATGVDTKPFRASLLSQPDLKERQKSIQAYVTSNPEGRQALAFVQPKPEQVKRADGSIIFLDQNPNSITFGKEVLPAQATGMTPAQIESNRIAQGQLSVAQGQLKVAQDRLAKEGASLDAGENAAISKAILEGRLDPNRVNGRNAKILATTLMADPAANLLELGVSAGGAMASEKSLATQTAKMSTAANEANKMVDVVRGLSDKVDRTEFPTINAISNAVSKGTGGKEIVQLNTSINALVNSYARAISPTGQPTVSDKNHAREIINSAYSQGQLGAILDVMQQEMSIARQAAGTASTELKAARETARGRGEAPTSNVVVTPDGQSHTFPNAAAAAQFKKAAGL